MAALVTNNAQGTLASAITAVATVINLSAGQGTLFPSPSGSDYAMLTMFNAGGTMEIVKLTSRATDALTVVRGQEGTAGFAFSALDKIEGRITAAAWANKLDKDTGGAIAGNITVGGTLGVTGLSTLGNLTMTGGTFIVPAGGLSVTTGTVNFTVGLQLAGAGVADISSTQTLTNKTLTTPTISAILNGGTLSLPSGTDTIVGRATTDTLTNKTITGAAVASTVLDDLGSGFHIGYKGLPQSAQNATFTLSLDQRGKHIYSKNVGAQTINVPLNATVAFLVEDFVTIINRGTTNISIVPAGGVTMELAGAGSTGTRTLAPHGICTLVKVETDIWVINGTGLT